MIEQFSINSGNEKNHSAPFQVLDIKKASYDVNWHSTLHSHSFYELFYCIEGEGSFLTNYGEQIIKKNSLIIVNPYVEHTEYSTGENPLEYIVIGFQGPEINLPNHAFDNGLFFFDDQALQFNAYLKEIIEICREDSLYSSAISQFLFNAVIFKIHSITNNHVKTEAPQALSANVTLAKNYIDSHFSKIKNLDEIEERTHLSKYHLSRQFKKELSQSPIEYLHSVRFYHAKELLESTNLTVTQISQNVGYNSITHFSLKFKKEFQQTPLNYRKMSRQQKADK